MALFGSSNQPMQNWQGKTVWIIGASTGIGAATARALHAKGAHVIVSARNLEMLHAFVNRHPGTQAFAMDACDRAAVQQVATQVLAQGKLDCVMYCAGYYKPMRGFALDVGDALRHMEVNYNGALYVLDALLPQLIKQGGSHISLVSSVAGYRGLPNALAYGPSKAALIHLAEALYLDLKSRKVAVSVVTPGFVETPLTAQNDFKMPALLTPAQAAQAILRGWAAGTFEIHFPKRFTLWLQVLRLLPYRLYFSIVNKVTA